MKLLEHVCQRETMAVYDAGGVHAMLNLVRQHGHNVHKDTIHSAMSVVTRLANSKFWKTIFPQKNSTQFQKIARVRSEEDERPFTFLYLTTYHRIITI